MTPAEASTSVAGSSHVAMRTEEHRLRPPVLRREIRALQGLQAQRELPPEELVDVRYLRVSALRPGRLPGRVPRVERRLPCPTVTHSILELLTLRVSLVMLAHSDASLSPLGAASWRAWLAGGNTSLTTGGVPNADAFSLWSRASRSTSLGSSTRTSWPKAWSSSATQTCRLAILRRCGPPIPNARDGTTRIEAAFPHPFCHSSCVVCCGAM